MMSPSPFSDPILGSASAQLPSQAGAGLGTRAPLGLRPVFSPPQLELVLLPSPSCYLIAGEPEVAPPWTPLLRRQERLVGVSLATGC